MGWQGSRSSGGHAFTRLVIEPPIEDVGLGLAIGSLLHDMGDPAAPPHLPPLPLDLLSPGQELTVMAVLYGQVIEAQGRPFLGSHLLGLLASGTLQDGPERNHLDLPG